MWKVGNIYVIASIAVVGGGLFGFDISSMSAQLAEMSYKCYFNQGPNGPPFNDKPYCTGPHALVQGGIVASMAAGSWLGALCSGIISDRIGRKLAIMGGCYLWLVCRLLFHLPYTVLLMPMKDYRLHPLLRFPEYRNADRWPYFQWVVCRNRISTSTRLY